MMPTLKKIMGLGICGFVCALSLNTANAETGVTDRQIVLGQSAAFSGPAAEMGNQMHLGAKAYFDYINAQGGIHGRKVELIKADDKHDPVLAAENTKRLIENDAVFALFGYVGTSTSNAALPIVNQAQVPFFAPLTGATSLREPFNRQIFNIRAGYHDEAEYLVKQLLNMGMKKLAVFYQDDAYGRTGLEGIQNAVKKMNLPVSQVITATVQHRGNDIDQAVAEILPARPDTVVQIGSSASCSAFIKAMRTAGYTGQFYNLSFVGSRALADSLGKTGVGVGISQVVPPPHRTGNVVVREYTKVLNKAGVEDVSFSSLEGFIAAKVFVEGLRRAGRDLTREKLIKALESINASNYDIGFPVNFSATNHNGSKYVDLTVIAKDAKFLY